MDCAGEMWREVAHHARGCATMCLVSVALIPYHRDFLELLCAWRKDPVMLKYNPVEQLSLESTHGRRSQSHSDFSEFDTAEQFFWLIQSHDKVVGNISLRNINRRMLNGGTWVRHRARSTRERIRDSGSTHCDAKDLQRKSAP